MGLPNDNTLGSGGGALISAGSMAGNITSYSMTLGGDCRCVGLQLHAASATHVGTCAVQVSNDGGTNWNSVTLSSTPTAASGSAFDAHVNLVDLCADLLQVVYTATSGVGMLYCYATPKI